MSKGSGCESGGGSEVDAGDLMLPVVLPNATWDYHVTLVSDPLLSPGSVNFVSSLVSASVCAHSFNMSPTVAFIRLQPEHAERSLCHRQRAEHSFREPDKHRIYNLGNYMQLATSRSDLLPERSCPNSFIKTL